MACPLLAALGEMENRREYIEDAANQIVVQASRLQDERTGLFSHMWDWQAGTRSQGFWGRGNGWVLMSLAETLEAMKKSDAKYGDLETIARKLAHGLEVTQDADGVWHTIVDDPTSYPECSATAMNTYGLLKLARLGVLSASVRSRALTAWRAINSRYVKDGLVTGVSAGTGPNGRDSYRAIAVGTQTWGTGAYLLAAAEIARK
jgi:unsaturated rhamnogalacturonyl hydrolase